MGCRCRPGTPAGAARLRAGEWSRSRPNRGLTASKAFSTRIDGKTLAVIGVGAMGGAAARWAKQRLKMRVLGVRRSGRGHRYVDEMYRPSGLNRVLPRADFVLVTAPLTRETQGFVGKRAFSLMKCGAGVINIARARVVDYDALADNLRRGRLRGAILDVIDPEPLPAESPLWSTPNLVIVPHVSSDDADDYIERTLDVFFDNVARFLSNRPLQNRVVKARQYGSHASDWSAVVPRECILA